MCINVYCVGHVKLHAVSLLDLNNSLFASLNRKCIFVCVCLYSMGRCVVLMFTMHTCNMQWMGTMLYNNLCFN